MSAAAAQIATADRGAALQQSLDRDLLVAHAAHDTDSLVRLYRQAGEGREQAGDIDAACFFYTHAYVFALESGHAAAGELLDMLVRHGRDATPG